MQKLDQKGAIGLIEVILIVAILGIIGFVGYRIYETNKDTADPEPVAQEVAVTEEEPQSEENSASEEEEELLEILEPETAIEISTTQDVSNLPESTPESFKHFMAGVVSTNTDYDGCVEVYSVTKITDVNIAGGVKTVAAEGQNSSSCGGAGGTVWYFDGEYWKSIGLQSAPQCEEIGDLVFSEFIASCQDSSGQMIDNPNGSILGASI